MKKILSKKFLAVCAVFLFLVFIYYSYLVAKEKFTQLDFDLTVKLQDKIPKKLDLPFSFFSVLGSTEVTGLIWLIILIFLLFKRFWFTALSFFLLPVALAIEVFGKLFVHHPAPPFLFYRGLLEVNLPLHFSQTDYSYPSGHETRTAFLIAFLVCYFLFRKKYSNQLIIQPILLGFLFVMTISRIYLGEHWTTDVIGGFLVGISFGILSGITVPRKLDPGDSGTL